jgi:hypothetical protein
MAAPTPPATRPGTERGDEAVYASVTTFHTTPADLDEVVRLGQEVLLPQMKDHPGFVGYYALADRATGKVVSVSLWESEVALQARDASSAARERAAVLAPYINASAPRTSERLEVVLRG